MHVKQVANPAAAQGGAIRVGPCSIWVLSNRLLIAVRQIGNRVALSPFGYDPGVDAVALGQSS